MVGYGTQLLKARRPGWEMAYIEYNELKLLLDEVNNIISKFCGMSDGDFVCSEQTSLINSDSDYTHELQQQQQVSEDLNCKAEDFLYLLRKEVEKVSLYAISRQGELADAIGSLRFNKGGENKEDDFELGLGQKLILTHHSLRREELFNAVSSDEDPDEKILSSAAETTLVNDLSALLPTVTISESIIPVHRYISRLSKEPRPMFVGSGVFKANKDSNSYSSCYSYDSVDASEKHWIPIQQEEEEEEEEDNQDMVVDKDVLTFNENHIEDYTVVAVEVLHLLRYICINAMAVRKIIKKYEKAMQRCNSHGFDLESIPDWDKIDDEKEIGLSGVISPLIGDQIKKCYDKHYEQLQLLATSQSMKALAASILLGSTEAKKRSFIDLSEALTITNKSLIRFKCAIYCIDVLQEYAEVVNQSFPAFLSRQAMIITGQELGNLGGMKVRALEVILKFDPDTILRMNDSQLLEWQEKCWAHSRSAGKRDRRLSFDSLEDKEGDLFNDKTWGGSDDISMKINFISTFLYTVNYYIVSPTANRYAILLGSDGAFGSTLIGGASLAAFFGCFLYSWWYTRFSFKSALIFSSFLSVLGNLLYAVAISFHSIKIAFIGRLFVGLGSAEVVNRQLISSCVHYNSMMRASASFVVASALGMSVGPLLAAVLDDFSGRDVHIDFHIPTWVPNIGGTGIVYDNVTSPAFLMAFLWFLEFTAIIFSFHEPERINSFKKEDDHKEKNWISSLTEIKDLIFSNAALPVTLLIYCYIEMVDEILLSSCAMVCRRYFGWSGSVAGYILAALGALVLPADFIVDKASRYYEERVIIKQSLLYICLGFFAIINYQGLLTDTTILGDDTQVFLSNLTDTSLGQLFQNQTLCDSLDGIEANNGQSSFNTSLGLHLPKRNIDNMSNGSHFGSLSPQELLQDTANITLHATKETNLRNHSRNLNQQENEHDILLIPLTDYDWNHGQLFYLFSLSFVFMATVVLEAVDTSVLSITAPAKLNSTFLSVGLLTTLMGTAGRCFGDLLITLSAVIDYLPFTDFVNSTFIPMIPVTMVGMYLVRRYFRSLIYEP